MRSATFWEVAIICLRERDGFEVCQRMSIDG